MIDISEKSWVEYIARLRRVNDTATNEAMKWLIANPLTDEESIKAFIDYCYMISTKYGEAAAELACQMYDATGELAGLLLDSAVPANTATYGEVAKSIRGALKRALDPSIAAQAVGRLVKMAGADTTLQNAKRDGAQFAWIPHGDTCAYCIALAANGWQDISKAALKDGHAEHIHANCDCTYGVRFGPDLRYLGYAPERYKAIYDKAEGSGREKINAMRRRFYAQNSEEINAQKRSAYEKRKERESSAAEEMNVN